jgi:hypothetical protein
MRNFSDKNVNSKDMTASKGIRNIDTEKAYRPCLSIHKVFLKKEIQNLQKKASSSTIQNL